MKKIVPHLFKKSYYHIAYPPQIKEHKRDRKKQKWKKGGRWLHLAATPHCPPSAKVEGVAISLHRGPGWHHSIHSHKGPQHWGGLVEDWCHFQISSSSHGREKPFHHLIFAFCFNLGVRDMLTWLLIHMTRFYYSYMDNMLAGTSTIKKLDKKIDGRKYLLYAQNLDS